MATGLISSIPYFSTPMFGRFMRQVASPDNPACISSPRQSLFSQVHIHIVNPSPLRSSFPPPLSHPSSTLLKRAGISQLDLVTVYISVVRPVLEYACPVWHTNMPKYLSDSIELIQNRALKSIFPGMSYNDILNDTGLRTLKEIRNVLCMKYFAGIQGSAHKLNGLITTCAKES